MLRGGCRRPQGNAVLAFMIYLRIACILSVARTHSFSITAKQLSISHQAVSRNIQKTEEELGFPLFIRNSQFVELTKSGEIYVQWLRELDAKLHHSWNKSTNGESEILRIAICDWIGYAPQIWRSGQKVTADDPNIQFEYLSGTLTECIDFLDRRIVDMIMIPELASLYLPDFRMRVNSVSAPFSRKKPLFISFHQGCELQTAEQIRAELARQPLILPDLDEATSKYLIQSVSHFFPEGDYQPSGLIRVPNTSTAYAEVMCGNGYTISPDNAPRLSRRFSVLPIPDAAAPIAAVWYYTQKCPQLPRYVHELMREEGIPC